MKSGEFFTIVDNRLLALRGPLVAVIYGVIKYWCRKNPTGTFFHSLPQWIKTTGEGNRRAIKRALAILIEDGLISCDRASGGRAIYRILTNEKEEEGIANLVGGCSQIGRGTHTKLVGGYSQIGMTYKHKEEEHETENHEIQTPRFAQEGERIITTPPDLKGKRFTKDRGDMKASEIRVEEIKEQVTAALKKRATKKEGSLSSWVIGVWQAHMAGSFRGKLYLTGKDKGQLKNFARAAEEEEIPKSEIESVVAFCSERWGDLRREILLDGTDRPALREEPNPMDFYLFRKRIFAAYKRSKGATEEKQVLKATGKHTW